jgi:hypothetical protein
MGVRPVPGRLVRWLPRVGAAALVAAALAGCTAGGGGWLPPDEVAFSGRATLGFAFSCERSSAAVNPNPPTGRLRLQLSYADHGDNPLGGRFTIHGEADALDPVLESMICIGEEPPPGGNELIVLGQYWPVSRLPPEFPAGCAKPERRGDRPLCRFEVVVRDNDGDRAPSEGDFFSIALSEATAVTGDIDAGAVVYARAGLLGGGNLKVD